MMLKKLNERTDQVAMYIQENLDEVLKSLEKQEFVFGSYFKDITWQVPINGVEMNQNIIGFADLRVYSHKDEVLDIIIYPYYKSISEVVRYINYLEHSSANTTFLLVTHNTELLANYIKTELESDNILLYEYSNVNFILKYLKDTFGSYVGDVLDYMKEVAQGNHKRILILEGAKGTGKSRFIEFANRVFRDGIVIMEGFPESEITNTNLVFVRTDYPFVKTTCKFTDDECRAFYDYLKK